MTNDSEYRLIYYRAGLPEISGLQPAEAILIDPVAFHRLVVAMIRLSEDRILTEILEGACPKSNKSLANHQQNEVEQCP
jgi:hypothetical protein